MGLWNKSLEDMLYGYDAELWDDYLKPIVQALSAVSYEDDSLSTVEDGPPYPWPREKWKKSQMRLKHLHNDEEDLRKHFFIASRNSGRDRLVYFRYRLQYPVACKIFARPLSGE